MVLGYDYNQDLPLWLAVEERAGGVEVHHLLVYQGTVALLGVLPGSVPEVTAADGFLQPHCSFSTRHHVQLVSKEYLMLINVRLIYFKMAYLSSSYSVCYKSSCRDV